MTHTGPRLGIGSFLRPLFGAPRTVLASAATRTPQDPSPAARIAAFLRERGAEQDRTAIVAASPLSDRSVAPRIRAAETGPVEILIMGEIGWEVTAQGVLETLSQAIGRDLLIRINSPGGNAFEGFAIYNILARHPGRKVVVVESVAASSATFVAMAGDEIVMAPASFMMIHNSAALTMGDRAAHEATISVLEKVDATMAGLYAARSGKSLDDVRALMAAETWFTAEEAVTEGFANRVEVPAAPAEPANPVAPPPGTEPLPAEETPEARGRRVAARSTAVLQTFKHPPAEAFRAVAALTEQNAAPAPAPAPVTTGTPAPNAHTQPPNNSPAPPAQEDPRMKATLAQLQAIAARAKLPADWVIAQLTAGATEAQARDAALEVLAGDHAGRPAVVGGATAASPAATTKAIVAAIARRGGVKREDITAAAAPMTGLSMRDMAAEFQEMRTGQRARLSTEALYRAVFASATVGMQTTSDFGQLLGEAIQAIVIDTAQRTSQEWRLIARTYDFDNFRPRDVAGAFDTPDLQEVLEHEEVTYGQIARALGRLGLKTFAKAFAFSRQAIINNDLTQFTQDGATYGAMAARSLSSRVWRPFLLGTTAEYNMTDGQPWLSSAHGNLAASGSAITEASLTAAEQALASQGRVVGKPLGLGARYLIVGINRRREGLKILSSEKAAGDNSNNTFQGNYTLVYEPSFPPNAWALMADPDTHPVIAVSLLNGVEAPQVATEASFETFGLKVRVSLDYEAAPIDWTGVYYNPGPA
ncbi:head maturation protease, ClpP-related [Muricoccus aerilatus]|uniref:head maturation protease, ClpP-related n=1 Tax=Muricoccus aerilatus TaxID=452982 RepID=UPI000B24D0DA|nr:head maturation protease, ClpP-related [Roseomonas aerilata]